MGKRTGSTKLATRAAPSALAAPQHRSGAVARMLHMPVATLRVWERRYALTDTAVSPGGQRLYSAEDVRRLAVIKNLTDLGHAIGTLAPLDMAQLQRVASTHEQALAATGRGQPADAATARADAPPQAWRLVVVGKTLGARLKRPSLLRQWGRAVELLGPFDDVAQALAALTAGRKSRPVDAWLIHEAQLQPGWQAALEAAVPALAPSPTRIPVAVLYGFASDAVCEALAASGVALLREPQPDVVLAQWLRNWAAASAARAPARSGLKSQRGGEAIASRRWDDAALADFAALATTVACDCPRHVAELLMQLSRFEAYSAQCRHRNPADADLHGYLGRVAAEARTRFEAALERVALHEGLLLPAVISAHGARPG